MMSCISVHKYHPHPPSFRIRAAGADPEYKFTKPLPKKAEKVVKRDMTIQCTVNDYKAPVRWFKGDVEIKVHSWSCI